MKRFASLAAPILLYSALLGLPVSTAQAQNVRMNMLCGERAVIVTALTDRYGEQVRGMGLANQDRIMEVYVSEETGTWTITVTSADGTTCLMAAGQHFAQMVPQPVGDDL